ncbi:NADPH-dependent oxidoreductase [Lactiplantibacillus garii]|uniref:NADPH-dependent oxidoreductase n=1 Tax=Lactiplantibacillus garii TaxID=2306423 RepID=A0A3R8KN06_9LACO|nr:nitroreductase family protein [Lactiplantibacillus garii]RRK11410.1 NADPH-dependent oxidoreductase [Lactiplantibacillus garii]
MSLSVIETLAAHRTQRAFTTQPVTDETFERIITAAQQMPTSQYLQAYSLVEVTDPAARAALAKITTMPTVGENGRLLVVLADQHRNAGLVPGAATKRALTEFDRFAGSIEDATLMTAAMVMVAESLGLGSVVLGSINNDTQAVIDLLHLPALTLPVFGLQLGYPTERPEKKPRLPLSAILFKDHYQEPATYQATLRQFDEQLHAYYQGRSSHARDEHLDHMTAEALHSAAKRRDFLKVVRRQGFLPELKN